MGMRGCDDYTYLIQACKNAVLAKRSISIVEAYLKDIATNLVGQYRFGIVHMPLMHTIISMNEHNSTNRQLRNKELGKLARKQRSGVCPRSRSERQCGRKREHGYFFDASSISALATPQLKQDAKFTTSRARGSEQ